MARIFISYKRADKDKVFPIVDEIRRKTGVDCWIDLQGIESGDQFQNVIIDAIDNSDTVVFMLSRNFIAPYIDEQTGRVDLKKQTFPEKEVMYALHHNKRLIPLSIDGTTVSSCKWLEFNCSGLDCIDWQNEDQRDKIIKNIKVWCGKEEMPVSGEYAEYPQKSSASSWTKISQLLKTAKDWSAKGVGAVLKFSLHLDYFLAIIWGICLIHNLFSFTFLELPLINYVLILWIALWRIHVSVLNLKRVTNAVYSSGLLLLCSLILFFALGISYDSSGDVVRYTLLFFTGSVFTQHTGLWESLALSRGLLLYPFVIPFLNSLFVTFFQKQKTVKRTELMIPHLTSLSESVEYVLPVLLFAISRVGLNASIVSDHLLTLVFYIIWIYVLRSRYRDINRYEYVTVCVLWLLLTLNLNRLTVLISAFCLLCTLEGYLLYRHKVKLYLCLLTFASFFVIIPFEVAGNNIFVCSNTYTYSGGRPGVWITVSRDSGKRGLRDRWGYILEPEYDEIIPDFHKDDIYRSIYILRQDSLYGLYDIHDEKMLFPVRAAKIERVRYGVYELTHTGRQPFNGLQSPCYLYLDASTTRPGMRRIREAETNENGDTTHVDEYSGHMSNELYNN